MAEIDPAQAFLQSLREDSIATSTPIVEEPAAQKPKIVGGFIDDDEEDDDEEYDPGASFQETGAGAQINVDRGTSSTPQQSVPQSPASAVVPSHSSKTVQTQEPIISASVVPLGNVPVPSATSSANGDGVPVESAVNVQSASVPPPQMPADPAVEVTSSSQSRLPLDRIGLLEDRVKEDPRGDIEAWLSLISEHKKRNKVDEVRGVYDRFFAVFPQAVSHCVCLNLFATFSYITGRAMGCLREHGVGSERVLSCGADIWKIPASNSECAALVYIFELCATTKRSYF